jgi:hypothetical protein
LGTQPKKRLLNKSEELLETLKYRRKNGADNYYWKVAAWQDDTAVIWPIFNDSAFIVDNFLHLHDVHIDGLRQCAMDTFCAFCIFSH